MLKRFTLTVFVSILTFLSAISQGSIKGTVLDETSEGFPFVKVALYQFGNLKANATTDIEGNFKISNIDAGSYDLEIKFVGYKTYRLEKLIVKGGKLLPIDDIQLSESTELLEVVEIM